MRQKIEDKAIQKIREKLKKMVDKTDLYNEEKICWLSCYYRIIGKRKKLLFYLNPRAKEIVFGVSHRGTDILETYPMISVLTDEMKKSVMKFRIKKFEDIEQKGIQKLITIVLWS